MIRHTLPLAAFAVILSSVTTTATRADAQVSTRGFVNNYILNRPTVSPYLNLVRRDGFGGVTNYQTLVRPQLEQREFARIQQAEINRVQQQLAVQQRQTDVAPQQRAQRVFSTGHPTQFQNTRTYYPGFNQALRR